MKIETQKETTLPQLQSSQQGFSTEKSASESPVKQNHYTVNPLSVFIGHAVRNYISKEDMELLEVDPKCSPSTPD